MQAYFEGTPVCEPAKNQEAFFDKASERALDQVVTCEMHRQQTDDQDRDANPEGATADPKQLLDFTLRSAAVVRNIDWMSPRAAFVCTSASGE
jgi:hypothetical protein